MLEVIVRARCTLIALILTPHSCVWRVIILLLILRQVVLTKLFVQALLCAYVVRNVIFSDMLRITTTISLIHEVLAQYQCEIDVPDDSASIVRTEYSEVGHSSIDAGSLVTFAIDYSSPEEIEIDGPSSILYDVAYQRPIVKSAAELDAIIVHQPQEDEQVNYG